MDIELKNTIKFFIDNGYSTRDIALKLNLSQTTLRRYMKKALLKTKFKIYGEKDHLCVCGEINPKNFYKNEKSKCKACHDKMVVEKQKENKIKAISFYGGKCIICGYDKIPALEFHHKDGTLKDKSFSQKYGWSWKRLEQELEKCVLVCSNCHKLIHAGFLRL